LPRGWNLGLECHGGGVVHVSCVERARSDGRAMSWDGGGLLCRLPRKSLAPRTPQQSASTWQHFVTRFNLSYLRARSQDLSHLTPNTIPNPIRYGRGGGQRITEDWITSPKEQKVEKSRQKMDLQKCIPYTKVGESKFSARRWREVSNTPPGNFHRLDGHGVRLLAVVNPPAGDLSPDSGERDPPILESIAISGWQLLPLPALRRDRAGGIGTREPPATLTAHTLHLPLIHQVRVRSAGV